MPDSLQTTQLHQLWERMQAGDREAHNELLRGVSERMEHLARKMLRAQFYRLKSQVQTEDVQQNASLRLLQALEKVKPDSMRSFYNLAALQIRRVLLDLARLTPPPEPQSALEAEKSPGVGRISNPSSDLELWSAFHEAVEKLPAEEREVFSLIFYHGWERPQVAELFQVSERTIRRLWHSACAKLHEALNGQWPE